MFEFVRLQMLLYPFVLIAAAPFFFAGRAIVRRVQRRKEHT